MADARLQILITARDQTAQAMASSMRRLESIKGQLRTTGLVLSGFAAVGIAAFKSILGSVFEEQQGINQLDASLKTLGLSYEGLKGPIEDTIASLQNKTNFGDEPQRDALRRLINVTGDYRLSLEALPVVLDVAAGAEMDLQAAALLVGRALVGDTEALNRYGIKLDETSTPTEVLAALTARFGGQAAAAAIPIIQLKNKLGDLFQLMGTSLLPVVLQITSAVGWFTDKLSNLNPTVLKVLTLIAAATVVFAAIAGPILILLSLLPAMAAGLGILTGMFAGLSIAMGPITLVILGIAAAIAAGILIWKNWDTIVRTIGLVLEWVKGKFWDFIHLVEDVGMGVVHRLIAVFGLLKDKLSDIGGALKGVFSGVAEGLKGALNAVISGFNIALRVAGTYIGMLKEALDAIPGGNPAGNFLNSVADALRRGIPQLQAGGIVTRPTLALVGERGPEAVVPLSGRGGFGSITVNINNATIFGEMDLSRIIVKTVRQYALGGGFQGVLATR